MCATPVAYGGKPHNSLFQTRLGDEPCRAAQESHDFNRGRCQYADGEKLSGMADKFIRESCINIAALFEYGNKTGMLYGWNISNVRKLSLPMHQLHLKRAPQSWQYINLNADDIESVSATSE